MAFSYKIFYDLAIILVSTKLVGTLMKKLGLPQVVGALIAGIIVGPAIWGLIGSSFLNEHVLVTESAGLDVIAQIGVVMLMFSAGLETNIKEMKSNGVASIVITMLGVVVPLAAGFLLACAFNGQFNDWSPETVYANVFFGILLTATSVGITVEALKEMGKLKGKVGSSILAAAILDDIIGIVILSVIIGIHPGRVAEGQPVDIGGTFLKIFLFFVVAIAVGLALRFLFKKLATRYPNHRRIPIYSLAVCFIFAFAAEEFFGIADITGAYVAGIIFSNISTTDYVDRKVDINSYMIFSPVFFASIGIKADFSGLDWYVVGFAVAFVVVGVLTKLAGCGLGAKLCGYSWRDSLRVGLGMIARGEVALIMANKGIEAGLIGSEYIPAIIVLVVATSLITPIFLKLTYKGKYALEPIIDMHNDKSNYSK